MSDVFEHCGIAGMELANRIIRSATCEGLSDAEGRPTEKLLTSYLRLADDGVGAIITGMIGVSRNGRTYRNMCMLDRDDFIDDYAELCRALRSRGVPLIAQLAHCGGQCSRAVSGGFNLAPSRMFYAKAGAFSQVITGTQIREIIGDFIDAVERAKQAGFSGVQLHAAHGYLLSQFLTGGLNRRRDEWGGSTQNRFRIIAEIMKGVRARVGNYPVLVKFSAYDFLKKGIREDEALRLAALFRDAGVDALEVSCGANDGFSTIRAKELPTEAILAAKNIRSSALTSLAAPVLRRLIKLREPPYAYNVDIAAKIRDAAGVPVIAVGGIRGLREIEEIIREGKADVVSMSRPFILEPDLVRKFREGKQERAKCIDCCHCMFRREGTPVRCFYGKVPS